MRLTDAQTQTIVQSVQRHLGRASRIWLFGSRLDDAKKGGDLDLFVETTDHALRNELRCKIELEETLDIPVDLIVRRVEERSPIAEIAQREGRLLR
ncbi:MAG: nucleotidyltransferase domain-containing protein [Lamprobacter sp.]|uniref:nucleotidyltransferase family protein n=1 Tax=Lamprobacter sp. TaxID=3100796 RepID=UPI002B256E1C|nr:nucleotidyltransferase domain-containing protein [Lamprobacter sp.]MEA3644022.1 nucleotidyltransferase domain-containing protein [Lamprobacter sp.]